jgi:hypothetical protein
MNKTLKWAIVLSVSLGFAAQPALAQGKGKDGKQDHGQAAKDHDKGGPQKVAKHQDKSDQGKAGNAAKHDNPGQSKAYKSGDRGNGKAESARASNHGESGKSGKYSRRFVSRDVRPDLQRYYTSNNQSQRYAAGAVTRAYARGADDGLFVITPNGNAIRVANRSGALLFDLDENRARNLGAWDVRPVDDRDNEGSPAFCRSGAGHPNWGRQWCIDKGFGLGNTNDVRWGRATTVGDIVFGQSLSAGDLARAALISAIGDLAFNRLALHSVSLGYTEPLTGVWVADPTGPRVLRVNSGVYPVAELVDSNTDNRADVLVVALRPW